MTASPVALSSVAFTQPFGGYKMSGLGRQNGIEGFEQHLQAKTIAYPVG